MMDQTQAMLYGRKKGCKYYVRNSNGGLLGGFASYKSAAECKARWEEEYRDDPWNDGVTVYIEDLTKAEETEDDLDDLLDDDGPCYDEVISKGTKVREKKKGDRLAQIYEYYGEQYALLWDTKTGQNLRYTNYKNILKEREERSHEGN